MSKTFTITENAVKNLINTYADHKLMCEWHEENIDEDELFDDPEYSHHSACCATAENWMKAIGISPSSNYVVSVINKKRERR